MSDVTKNKRGSGRFPGSGKVNGRGHATIEGCGAGRGNGSRRGQRLPDGSSSNEIFAFGLSHVGFGEERQKCEVGLSMKRFRAHFGVSPKAIKALVALLKHYYPSDQVSLLVLCMAICWLKLYETEHVMAGRWDYGEKHCREQVRLYVQQIGKLKPKLINFDNLSQKCKFAPVDNMHRMMWEFRCDPDSKWWSHKFNGPGVGYEVVTNPTDKGLMMWASGPYPAGTHDLTCFRGGKKGKKKEWKESSLYNSLPTGLRLVGDSGYAGQFDKVTTTMDAHSPATKELFARLKSMQETLFKRFKDFKVIRDPFWHGKNLDDKMLKAKESFDAVAVLIQLDIENGHPLFEP